MWTAIGITLLFILIVGIVECKKCPYKKWLCFAADDSKECYAQRRNIRMETGKSGLSKQSPTPQQPTDDAASTATKNK